MDVVNDAITGKRELSPSAKHQRVYISVVRVSWKGSERGFIKASSDRQISIYHTLVGLTNYLESFLVLIVHTRQVDYLRDEDPLVNERVDFLIAGTSRTKTRPLPISEIYTFAMASVLSLQDSTYSTLGWCPPSWSQLPIHTSLLICQIHWQR